ncbi:MAG: AsnC family transcriptional regulator [Hyphomicrobiaceae bacterium]
MRLDDTDRKLIAATQSGLPLVAEPFAQVAQWLGLAEDEVLERFAAMQAAGVMRRVAIAPNHYALGTVANGMTVWDVADDSAEALGPQVGALDCVSHCYLRPRVPPQWPYNLFAMIHGTSTAEVEAHRHHIRHLLGSACRADDILYSKRILKKTGLRIKPKGN